MGKNYVKEQTILYLFKGFITLLFATGMYFLWTVRFNSSAPTPFYRWGNYFLFVLFVLIYGAFVKVYGGFLVGTATVIDLIFSQVIAIAFLQGVSYIICYRTYSAYNVEIMLTGKIVKEFLLAVKKSVCRNHKNCFSCG